MRCLCDDQRNTTSNSFHDIRTRIMTYGLHWNCRSNIYSLRIERTRHQSCWCSCNGRAPVCRLRNNQRRASSNTLHHIRTRSLSNAGGILPVLPWHRHHGGPSSTSNRSSCTVRHEGANCNCGRSLTDSGDTLRRLRDDEGRSTTNALENMRTRFVSDSRDGYADVHSLWDERTRSITRGSGCNGCPLVSSLSNNQRSTTCRTFNYIRTRCMTNRRRRT
mmetsp:Transcript_17006/g.46111  ORF Transcript_17006/g.46111 Transcript_17006/m.46111 type:complete len:219 (+) Transcript_17006:4676-5332(+)